MHHLPAVELLSEDGSAASGAPGAGGIPLAAVAGLTGPGDLVDGRVTLRDLHRRNRVILVERAGAPGLAVKRGPGVGGEIANLRRLAVVPGLAEALPRIASADPARGEIVLRAEQDGIHLWEHHTRERRFAPAIGAAIGSVLGRLHRGTRGWHGEAGTDGPPSSLTIHRPVVDDLRHMSPASMELAREIQHHASLAGELDRLRADWRAECLVHDDVKWANVLVVPRDGGEPTTVQLIDWEHLRAGDPAWDVGSALAAYVAFWIDTIPSGRDGGDLQSRARAASAPIEDMHPAMAAVWERYLREGAAPAGDARDLMRRASCFCAVRLIRSAFEETETRETMTMRAGLHLQVAANVLDDPLAAAEGLLGLAVPAA